MEVHLIALIICSIGLFSSGSEAQFPFQTGPVLYDPYASFFGSNELNPFESSDMRVSLPRPSHHEFHKRPFERKRMVPYDKLVEHREYHKKLYESEPSKWRKYSRTSYMRGLPKRNLKKTLLPAPKFNGYNKELIRPRPESDVDSIQKHISYQRNHFNSKPVINYKNSNTFRESVPRKPLSNKPNHSSDDNSEKRTDNDSDDNPSTLDIEMNGEEENEEQSSHNQNENRNRNKVQYSSAPNHMTTFKPHNYHIKERAYNLDNSRPKRPALYEIEAPKNLDRNKPSLNGPAFIQKISVPHQTLLEIADISGPPRPQTSRRPHPFEGFHQQPRPKPESEIIVNSLGDGMTRQVGASMSVQLEDKNFAPKGKIFDEPLIDSNRRQMGKSYQQKPFRPNDRNPFNSKHFEAFTSPGFHNNNEFRALNSLKKDENPFPHIESKSSDDYDDNNSDNNSDSNEESNDYPKMSESLFDDEPKRPQTKPLTDNSSQRPPITEPNEVENSEETEEWTSNGSIPGSPGKDYPTLSGVPVRSEFSCMGRPYGFYADVSQKCQVYHQCSAQGSQRFLCPNGTLFNQESLVCEWWYNVLCENSEKLYHKNAQLYRNDNQRQNDDINNDENRNNGNHNEYNKSWNFQNSNNNRNDNNHNYNNHNNYHNNNHNNNPNPHNHYSNKNFRVHSDRNSEHHSRAPEVEYDNNEEIDVDLSNDESRNNFIKVLSNHQLVSKLNAFNKTKNIVFHT